MDVLGCKEASENCDMELPEEEASENCDEKSPKETSENFDKDSAEEYSFVLVPWRKRELGPKTKKIEFAKIPKYFAKEFFLP